LISWELKIIPALMKIQTIMAARRKNYYIIILAIDTKQNVLPKMPNTAYCPQIPKKCSQENMHTAKHTLSTQSVTSTCKRGKTKRT
jgi:hypothetical protein